MRIKLQKDEHNYKRFRVKWNPNWNLEKEYIKACLEEQTKLKWTIDGIFLLSKPLQNRKRRRELKGSIIEF